MRKLIPLIALVLCIPTAHAAPKAKADMGGPIFEQSATFPGGITASVTAITDGNRSGTISNVNQAIASVQQVAAQFNPNDPNSTLSQINSKAGSEPVAIDPAVTRLIELALNLNEWTHGAFDVTHIGLSRKVKLDKRANSVQFKNPAIKLHFDGVLYGYLADLLTQAIYNGGTHNFMVTVNGISRSQGQNTIGPWRIDVAEDNGKFAQRGLSLSFSGMAVAIVGMGHDKPLVDPRNDSPLNGKLKGLTVLGRDAATTQGIGWAMYILGPGGAQSLAAELQNLRYVILDNAGTMIKSPGL